MRRRSCLAFSAVLLLAGGCVEQPKDPGWRVGEPSPVYDAAPRPTVSIRVLPPFNTDAATVTADWFSDGQFAIGEYLTPGRYVATPVFDGCYWEIAADFSGQPSAVLSNGTGTLGEQVAITLRPSDEVVKSRGCGTWRRTEENAP